MFFRNQFDLSLYDFLLPNKMSIIRAVPAIKRFLLKRPLKFCVHEYKQQKRFSHSDSINKPSTSSEFKIASLNVPISKEKSQTIPIFKCASDTIDVVVENGLPVFEIPLPSRFVLMELSTNVVVFGYFFS